MHQSNPSVPIRHGPTPGLLTIFENMQQIPGDGDKKHVKMPRSRAKSVANPRGQLDCSAKKSRLSNYLKIKRILSSTFNFERMPSPIYFLNLRHGSNYALCTAFLNNNLTVFYFIKCSETDIVLFYIIIELSVIVKLPNP
jgi:hypothetical protein